MSECDLTVDDIWLVPEDEGYKVVFQSLEGFNIIWTKDQAQQVKRNILNNNAVVKKLKEKLLEYQNRGWATEVSYKELLESIYFTDHVINSGVKE